MLSLPAVGRGDSGTKLPLLTSESLDPGRAASPGFAGSVFSVVAICSSSGGVEVVEGGVPDMVNDDSSHATLGFYSGHLGSFFGLSIEIDSCLVSLHSRR